MSCATTICTPTYSVPGPQGEDGIPGAAGTDGVNAFTLTTANFSVPAELGTVVVSVEDNRWMTIGQPVYVQTVGFYLVFDVNPDGVTVTLQNLAETPNNLYPQNAPVGSIAAAGVKISPAGFQGVNGFDGATGAAGPAGAIGNPGSNAFTATTADYTQPAVGADVLVSVEDNQWMGLGEPVYIVSAAGVVGGWYTVIAFVGTTQVQLRNLGYPTSAAPATVLADPMRVMPSGIQGATGATGPAGPASAIANYFRAVKNGVNQTIASGAPLLVTFGTDLFDPSNVWDAANSRFVAPATGFYLLTFQLTFTSAPGAFGLVAYRGGGFGVGVEVGAFNQGAAPGPGAIFNMLLSLTAADTVELWILQTSGGPYTIDGANARTTVWGFRVA